MTTIDAKPTSPRKVELHGLLGSFTVPNPAKRIRVHFFSTLASNRAEDTGSAELLRELMPMRERVSPSQLKDLNALLQRDLNDARVAHELVPYLMGESRSGVAFFPAILAALIPKGFIVGRNEAYPKPQLDESGHSTSFGNCWTITNHTTNDGVTLPLGLLTIYPNRTDIIVLDGQHRANAFRFVCGVFPEAKSVYSAFYQQVQPPTIFEADLPVTVIWFSGDNQHAEVRPALISRNLFVDVNTTAQRVSTSRRILLDDRHVTALVTRFFLSEVAKEVSFEPANFSLLHSGFDVDSDLVTKVGHVFTLTNPELLEYGVSWMLLGSRHYNARPVVRVSKEHKRKQTGEFAEIIDSEDFTCNDVRILSRSGSVVIGNIELIPVFEQIYKAVLHPVLYGLFDRFCFFRTHYKASEVVSAWVTTASTIVRDVWEHVFCGGEGLYYSLTYYHDGQGQRKAGGVANNLLKGIEEIEQKLCDERASLFESSSDSQSDHVARINKAFSSARTKAFQVGMIMALDEWKKDSTFIAAYEDYLDRLNAVAPDQWVVILVEIRGQLLSTGVDPKSWPMYQNLILRIIQDDDEPYFDQSQFLLSPDGIIFRERVSDKFRSWIDNEDIVETLLHYSRVPVDLQRKWGQDAKRAVDELFAQAGLKGLDANPVAEAKKVVTGAVEKYNNA